MPYCSRIVRYQIIEYKSTWAVTYVTPLPVTIVNFPPIFANTFPNSSSTYPGWLGGLEGGWASTVTIPKGLIQKESLERFLEILRWTVTIQDDADESHAVYLHHLPFPKPDPEDPDAADFRPSRVGKMVQEAKSYDHTTGNLDRATELADKYLKYWIVRHPRYVGADSLVPAPPGNPNKQFDLPLHMATYLAKDLRKNLLTCVRTKTSQPQKGLGDDPDVLHTNVAGKFRIDADLKGRTVMILDDIYRSGSTVCEMVRTCRAAGARVVLSLTATKTAKFCRGVTPTEWYTVTMEATGGRGGGG